MATLTMPPPAFPGPSPFKPSTESDLPDDIRLRYAHHLSGVKTHVLSAFREQTDWLTMHLDAIRMRYPPPADAFPYAEGAVDEGGEEKAVAEGADVEAVVEDGGKRKGKGAKAKTAGKGRKAKKPTKPQDPQSEADDRPAFNDLIKSPRKRPAPPSSVQAISTSAVAPPPKLNLLAAADPNVPSPRVHTAAVTKPASKPLSGKSTSSNGPFQRATSPLSPRQAPSSSSTSLTAALAHASQSHASSAGRRHTGDKENASAPAVFSPKANARAGSVGREREREKSPAVSATGSRSRSIMAPAFGSFLSPAPRAGRGTAPIETVGQSVVSGEAVRKAVADPGDVAGAKEAEEEEEEEEATKEDEEAEAEEAEVEKAHELSAIAEDEEEAEEGEEEDKHEGNEEDEIIPETQMQPTQVSEASQPAQTSPSAPRAPQAAVEPGAQPIAAVEVKLGEDTVKPSAVEKEERAPVPEADEDEAPPPSMRHTSPVPSSTAAASAPSLLIPTSLSATHPTASAPASLPTLSHPQHRPATISAPHPPSTAPLPPSPSSAFLGRMGLPIPTLGRALGPHPSSTSTATSSTLASSSTAASTAFVGTQSTNATSLGSLTSPRSSIAPPPPLGSLALGLKRTSAAADLTGHPHGKDGKVPRTEGVGAKTPGGARLESVKEALSKMRSQRASVAVSASNVTASLMASVTAASSAATAAPLVTAAPSVSQAKAVPAPVLAPEPATQPRQVHTERRISALPKRLSSEHRDDAAAASSAGGLRKRSSVGDLVKRLEQRRESIEASQHVPAGLRVSGSPAPVLKTEDPVPERRRSSLGKGEAKVDVAPPHPTTTPPGSPPTLRKAPEPLRSEGEEQMIDEVGFEDGMVIEDSMAQPLRSEAEVEEEPVQQQVKKANSVLALAGLGPRLESEGDEGDGSDVISTQPIEFFDAEEDEPVDPAAALAAATYEEYEQEVEDEDEGEEVTRMTRAEEATGTVTMDLSTLAMKTLAAEKKAAAGVVGKTSVASKGKSRADESQTTMDLSRRTGPGQTSTLRKTPSTASLTSTKSMNMGGGGGFGGLLSKAGSALATTWTGKKPEVKSLQLAAAAAKKEQEEKERKLALKEERRIALEKKQADDRAKLDAKAAEAERKRKERDEVFGKKVAPTPSSAALKPKPPVSRPASEEPGKKRKVEEVRPIEAKKIRPAPETPSGNDHHRVLKQTATFQPTRPAPPPPSTIKPSAMSAAAVGVKTMNETIRVVGPGAAKPKAPVAGPSKASTSSMHGIGKLHPSQTLAVHPSNVWPPPKTPAAGPSKAQEQPAKLEPYVELPSIDSEYSDDDEEERERKNAALPPWAQSPYLREALEAQSRIDPGTIFGPIPDLKMEELFRSKTGKFRMRTSSAHWDGPDGLTAHEEAEYARRMGYHRIATVNAASQNAQHRGGAA